MSYIIFGVKLGLMFLSNIGYCMWLCKKNINMYFTPAITIAFQISVLFFAGLWNLLYPAAVVLYGLGLFLLAVYCIKLIREKTKKRFEIPCGFFFMSIMLLVLLFALKGHSFAHYDDFSHWGLVVQELLMTDQFPTFKSLRIGFQAYPLGSAVFIYYFSKFVEDWEAVQMYAQAYMEVCFIFPVFAFAKKNRLFEVAMLIITNIVLCMNVSVYALLVDTVLPLAGVAVFLFVYYYYSKDIERDILFYVIVAMFLIMTIQIKNSGMIFMAVVGLFLLVTSPKKKMNFVRLGVTIAAPAMSVILWKKHCDYVFISAETSKHAMSLTNYWAQFAAKTTDDIIAIFLNIINRIIHQKMFWILVIIWVAMYMAIYIWNKEIFSKYKALIITSVITFVVYVIGIFAMYIFSMPNSIESQQLFGFERYFYTIAIFFFVLSLIPVAEFTVIEKEKKKVMLGVCAITLVYSLMWVNQTGRFMLFTELRYDEQPRIVLEKVIEENAVVKGKRYVICAPVNPDVSYTYMGKYSLLTNEIYELIDVKDTERLEELVNNKLCDYVIILDKENEILNKWVNENYPGMENNSVIVIE